MIYADPSFLCSLYGWDANSPTAIDAFSKERHRPLFFTPWQRFEVHNSIRLAAGRLSRGGHPVLFQIGNVLRAIREDLSAGRLRHVDPDSRDALRLAEELSERHTESIGTGAVDVWHVAAAVMLNAEVFWTFDDAQRKLALACGRLPRVPTLSAA
jgi:hypothetical protein